MMKKKISIILSAIMLACLALTPQTSKAESGYKYLADVTFKITLEGVYMYSECLDEEGSSCDTKGAKFRLKVPKPF
jgi:hypothetical protein